MRVRFRRVLWCTVLAATLLCAACGAHSGTFSGSCVAPYLDSAPPDTSTVAAHQPIKRGEERTVYGHWYTSTCNDTGGHDPLQPLPPVHLKVIWPNGAVEDLGTFMPSGQDLGFQVVIKVPEGMPAGTAKLRDDQDYPSTYRFRVAR